MIGEGLFQTQLSTVEKILACAELFEERQKVPEKNPPAALFRGMQYWQVYEKCIQEFIYDFRLVDQSLLLFVKGSKEEHISNLSFSFYECPHDILPYNDFVEDYINMPSKNVRDEYRREYDQYVSNSSLKRSVTPLRYDYMPSAYRRGIHPASHVHFGFSNEIRVATSCIMNPISFTLFVLRQRYPTEWLRLSNNKDVDLWCRNVRNKTQKVDDMYWSDDDKRELWLY
jgi:hypothetical protein